MSDEVVARYKGCLLTAAITDALGAGVEFSSAAEIASRFGHVNQFINRQTRQLMPPHEHGKACYTDDAEMLLALCQSITECGALNAEHCAMMYAKYFTQPPARGYGPAASKSLVALHKGMSYKESGKLVYPEGSRGNGGAMRIAPVALAFRDCSLDVLNSAVRAAVMCTHLHDEAVDAAFLQALSIRYALKESVDTFDPEKLVSYLIENARTAIMKEALQKMLSLSRDDKLSDLDVALQCCSPNEYGTLFQVFANEALACTNLMLLRHWKEPVTCISRAIGLGGDTDTIATILGAVLGALYDWLPAHWVNGLENNGDFGRDAFLEQAGLLAELSLDAGDITYDLKENERAHVSYLMEKDLFGLEKAMEQMDLDDNSMFNSFAEKFTASAAGSLFDATMISCGGSDLLLACGGKDGVSVWNLNQKILVSKLRLSSLGSVRKVCTLCESLLICAGSSGAFAIIEVHHDSPGITLVEVASATNHAKQINCVALVPFLSSATAFHFAIGSLDSKVSVWSYEPGDTMLTCLGVLRSHSRGVSCIVSLYDGIVSSGLDGNIIVWKIYMENGSLHHQEKKIISLKAAVSCIGLQIASGSLYAASDAGVTHISFASQSLLAETQCMSLAKGKIVSLDCSDDIVAFGTAKALGIYRIAQGSVEWIADPHSRSLHMVRCLDNDHLLTTGSIGDVSIWNCSTQKAIFNHSGHSRRVTASVFVPELQQLVTVSEDKVIRWYGQSSVNATQQSDNLISEEIQHAFEELKLVYGADFNSPTVVNVEDIAWILEQVPLSCSIAQLSAHVGEIEASEILATFMHHDLQELLPLMNWHGICSRWKQLIEWVLRHMVALESVNHSLSSPPTLIQTLVGFSVSLGTVSSYRALAMDCHNLSGRSQKEQEKWTECTQSFPLIRDSLNSVYSEGLLRILENDTIWPSGRLRTDEQLLKELVLQRGYGPVCFARLYIGLGLLPYDPSLSLHDDCETALCIASGYLKKQDHAIFLFEICHPIINSCGWTVYDVRKYGDSKPDERRWFGHRGIYFDSFDQTTERYVMFEIPFLQRRCVGLRVITSEDQIAEELAIFAASQLQKRMNCSVTVP